MSSAVVKVKLLFCLAAFLLLQSSRPIKCKKEELLEIIEEGEESEQLTKEEGKQQTLELEDNIGDPSGTHKNLNRRSTLKELLEKEEENEHLIEQSRVLLPYRQRVDAGRAAKMDAEFKEMPELLDNNFNEHAFRKLVYSGKPCGQIQIAVYNLMKNSSSFGIFHVGVYVCMIEIHFHRPGVEYWQPHIYHTKFSGGHYKRNDLLLWKRSGFGVHTKLSFAEIYKLVKQNYMDTQKYAAHTYNVLLHNCLDFAKELVLAIADKRPGDSIVWPSAIVFPTRKPALSVQRSFKGISSSVGSKSFRRIKSTAIASSRSRTTFSGRMVVRSQSLPYT